MTTQVPIHIRQRATLCPHVASCGERIESGSSGCSRRCGMIAIPVKNCVYCLLRHDLVLSQKFVVNCRQFIWRLSLVVHRKDFAPKWAVVGFPLAVRYLGVVLDCIVPFGLETPVAATAGRFTWPGGQRVLPASAVQTSGDTTVSSAFFVFQSGRTSMTRPSSNTSANRNRWFA